MMVAARLRQQARARAAPRTYMARIMVGMEDVAIAELREVLAVDPCDVRMHVCMSDHPLAQWYGQGAVACMTFTTRADPAMVLNIRGVLELLVPVLIVQDMPLDAAGAERRIEVGNLSSCLAVTCCSSL